VKRTLLIASCCALPIFFSSFAYSADGPYLGAIVGVAFLSDSDVTDSTAPGIPLELSYDSGLKFGAAIGYRFLDNARIEGEVSYQQNDVDQTSALGVSLDSTGDAAGIAFLVNGYYDFTNTTAFTPYVSAGLGFAKVEINDYNILGSGTPDFSDDDSVFAYQVGLGIGYAVTDKVTLDVKYRYFAAEDAEFDTTEVEIASHDILLGVRFNF
jgi:opacity protein-like surface antigen